MTHCRPHPTSRVCMVQGDHLAGCDLTTCAGCVACARHNPWPTQRPASTSDARKRRTETTDPAHVAGSSASEEPPCPTS